MCASGNWPVCGTRIREIVQSLAGTQSELAALGAELAGLREQLSTAQRSLQDSEHAGEQLSEEKRDLQSQLQQSATEGQRLRQELEALNQHAEVLRRDLVTTDAGQELLDLRSRLSDITDDRAKIAETLAEKRAELKSLTATEEILRRELEETRCQRESAEQQAAANSELQLNKDNEVLRGIVARQNTTLGVYYSEVRRMRRARFGLRIIYGLFAIVLLVVVAFGVLIFTHQGQGVGKSLAGCCVTESQEPGLSGSAGESGNKVRVAPSRTVGVIVSPTQGPRGESKLEGRCSVTAPSSVGGGGGSEAGERLAMP